MKNTFLLVCACFLISVSAQSQTKKKSAAKVSKVTVPESVSASFKGSYANVEKNKWSRTYTGNYVSVFSTPDSLAQEVEYNNTGVMVKTKTTYTLGTTPAVVGTAIEDKYPGAVVSEVVKMEIPGVKPYYKVKLTTAANAKRNLLISEEGAIAQ